VTATGFPLDGETTVRAGPASPGVGARAAPVIILTYPHAGAERLTALLARHPDLACTAGTGILPLCEQAATAWRAADGRPGPPLSLLAEASTRALVTTILTSLLARQGRRRWCEIATAAPDAAGIFARLFPGTRIACLHRACPDVVHAAVNASPWGLAEPAYAPFTSAHPSSTAAALTGYWTARTAYLLAFEQAHPATCQRLRYEDLTDGCLPGLFGSLGIGDSGPGSQDWFQDDTASPAPSAAGLLDGFPVGQIPRPLLRQASQLMEELGYEPLASG
jgi:hypothetical protein